MDIGVGWARGNLGEPGAIAQFLCCAALLPPAAAPATHGVSPLPSTDRPWGMMPGSRALAR